MWIKRSLYVSSVLMAASGVASAQAPPTPATPPAQSAPPAAATDCSPTKPVPPRGTIAPEGSTTGQRTESLGDKLARSDGVLCPPPGVDFFNDTATTETGNMPVIPPPGSPGGDPSVRPK